MKKSLLIFDLDGTLINTLKDLNIATNYALAKFGYPLRTIDQTRRDIGNGVAKLIERSIPNGIENKDYPLCLSIFKDYYKVHYFENSFPYEGIKETLTTLKNEGYTLAVVSNKFDEGAKKLVTYYLPGLFATIQGTIPELRPKPYSDLVEKVLNELHFKKEDALYIGDTNVDYETATNSGLDCVLVSYGYRSKDFLLELTKSSPIIDSISELINLLH